MDYFERKEANRKVFRDTMEWIKMDESLSEAVKNSVSKQFVWKHGEKFPFEAEERKADRNTKVFTSTKRTFEAAESYAKAGKKTCVLNFANSHHVGGGVWGGAGAQEECLCRCSTLYPCISDMKMMKEFYEYHKNIYEEGKIDDRGNDDLIFTPEVVVCKTDVQVPERLEKQDWYKVSVITCAAPEAKHLNLKREEEYSLHLSRFTAILETAAKTGAEVLILGAFGCGAFGNHPKVVAEAACDALKPFQGIFDVVEFAVYSRNGDTENYSEFEKIYGGAYV